MMTSDDKVGEWVKKGQNHDDVILECSLWSMSQDHCVQYTAATVNCPKCAPQILSLNGLQKREEIISILLSVKQLQSCLLTDTTQKIPQIYCISNDIDASSQSDSTYYCLDSQVYVTFGVVGLF